jgi:hypothetical protein
VVLDGRTGFFAGGTDQWVESLRLLFESPLKRAEFGVQGRQRVLRHYDRRVIAPRVGKLLDSL